MENLSFYFVDVFAEEKYAGNQLAVVRNARDLSAFQMQRIANEMHFSETAFILSDEKRNGGYEVRIFTPASEVPFAGHPTLGTAYVIKHSVSDEITDEVILNLKVGQIPVVFKREKRNEETLWMKQIRPTFGKTLDAAKVSAMLNLSVQEIDSRYPIQEVSTGLPFVILPLKTLDAVKRVRIDKDEHLKLAKETQAEILVFSPETYRKENNLNVRVFVDLYGIPEDPATGSANGCLAAYLSRYKYFGDDAVDVRVEQGCEIGRPSLLYLKAQKRQGEIQVSVGGKVVMVAQGELL
ncbi:MAG TPA: PhzF family phenazine biosynthesis protein [Candidatus Bathyarchaeia archaeon]|nr:PhzF family phenazine biosynthesis protein [Candidatus Bathyarchaeia archaeon]